MSEETKRLTSIQRILLPEKSYNINATFANFNENLLCAIWGLGSIYELWAAKGSSKTPYIELPRPHAMPAKVNAICSLDGEWRLAASLIGKAGVALFCKKNEQLTLLVRLETTVGYSPGYLAPISKTNALLLINSKSVADGKWSTSIELYVPDHNGKFEAPRTILPADRGYRFIAPFVFRNATDDRLHAIMFDRNSETLHFYDFC